MVGVPVPDRDCRCSRRANDHRVGSLDHELGRQLDDWRVVGNLEQLPVVVRPHHPEPGDRPVVSTCEQLLLDETGLVDGDIGKGDPPHAEIVQPGVVPDERQPESYNGGLRTMSSWRSQPAANGTSGATK